MSGDIDEEALIERTLLHLHLCLEADAERAAFDDESRLGPVKSSWADLLAALMEGLRRGWVEEVNLRVIDGTITAGWSATDRGSRAIAAFRTRIANAPVVDEFEDEP